MGPSVPGKEALRSACLHPVGCHSRVDTHSGVRPGPIQAATTFPFDVVAGVPPCSVLLLLLLGAEESTHAIAALPLPCHTVPTLLRYHTLQVEVL